MTTELLEGPSVETADAALTAREMADVLKIRRMYEAGNPDPRLLLKATRATGSYINHAARFGDREAAGPDAAARRARLDLVGAHLAEHAAGALGDPGAIASGLHALAALAGATAFGSDPGLARMARELSEASRQVDALSAGGKLLHGLKADAIAARRKELEKAIAARRREMFEALGEPGEAMARDASAGDPSAIEGIALAILDDPECFPAGLLGRILDLQADALCRVPTLVMSGLNNLGR